MDKSKTTPQVKKSEKKKGAGAKNTQDEPRASTGEDEVPGGANLVPIQAQLEAMRKRIEQLKAGQSAIQATLKGGKAEENGAERTKLHNPEKNAGKDTVLEVKIRETKAMDTDELRRTTKSAKPVLDGKEFIWEILRVAEEEEERKRRMAGLHFDMAGMKERLRVVSKDPAALFQTIDIGMVAVILANAVVIGLSIDAPASSNKWKKVDLVFSITFLAELIFKTCLVGPVRQFCGKGMASNLFDAGLIMTDIIQFATTAAGMDKKGPSASLFRTARLVRLARVLRVLRLEFFQGLLAMLGGLVGGAPTLLCAMGLFGVSIYILGLVFRETVGAYAGTPDDQPNTTNWFDTVPRSMFTMFRCSFGDCGSTTGYPIFYDVSQAYGGGYLVAYCLIMFGMIVGLFNVISAIFVEETMKAAARFELFQKNERLNSQVLWSVNVSTLIRCLLEELHRMEAGDEEAEGYVAPEPVDKLTDHIEEILALQVPGPVFDKVIREREDARDALDALDIDSNDHGVLSDILDPDNGGIIDLMELVDGLRRLRGEPRRSDIVSVDLMVRSLQKSIGELLNRTEPS